MNFEQNATSLTDLLDDVPGVLEANQQRSVRIRDSFINAGIDLLNEERLHQVTITNLAKLCGCSVGSFYTRFEDKEAYFRALRVATIHACNEEIERRVSVQALQKIGPKRGLEELVNLMSDLFTSRFRGVLRESLLRILEPDDPWAPMRDSARGIMANYHQAFEHEFRGYKPKEARRRLSFCFQMIVGVLQNDLVNDYHVFSTRDRSLRNGLKEAVLNYLNRDDS